MRAVITVAVIMEAVLATSGSTPGPAAALRVPLLPTEATSDTDTLPTLPWPSPAPSDWVTVTQSCGGVDAAVGDGVHDDTAAIQVESFL